MAKDRKPAEDLSIEELEVILARKRLEARRARVQRFQKSGRALRVEGAAYAGDAQAQAEPEEAPVAGDGSSQESGRRWSRAAGRLLLWIEIAAVAGLVFVLFSGVAALRQLNQEVAEALGGATPTATPLITAVVLPSGHIPPTSPGGARPNEAEIPEHLRPLVQSMGPLLIPTAGPEQARSIFIPALWNSPAPVVQGDGWEQLKKGVGQHVGTSNPGQNGNMVVSAHNDIFGELFRDLDELKPGDEIILSTATAEYVYRVTGVRIVEPTEVSVMEPTRKPTITLISCYPYLVDTERIIVFGALDEA